MADSSHLRISLVDDVEAIADRYLDSLNMCFPGWGDRDTFDWCFRRQADGPPADLFVVEDDGKLVAGSATTYRMAQRRSGETELIGCMTATWTLRSARGRGLFERLIEASKLQAHRRGCRLLIAFAGAGKASRPGLLAAGARDIEGAYLTSAGHRDCIASSKASLEETLAAFAGSRAYFGRSRLVYSPEAWRGQMLERPHPVERRRLAGGAIALIERAGEVDRLLDVSTPGGGAFVTAVEAAAAASHGAGRLLSAYSLDRAVIEALTARGFTATRAWLYLMPTTGAGPLGEERWWFANGDRM